MTDKGEIIAGTGHRPHKLGGYDRITEIKCIKIAMDFLRDFQKNREINSVICGMALGWDQALAEAAYVLRIPVIAYVPCRNMDKHWTSTAKDRWNRIMDRADAIFSATKDDYVGPWCMQKRNEMMIDDCTVILALWDGSDGGTANCLGYAQRKHPNKEVFNMWPKWQKIEEQRWLIEKPALS